jgi:hypothetical protein
MPIILPSSSFEGSDLNLNYTPSSYIKDGVPKAVFTKAINKEGAYMLFLPAYKADRAGNGVWYKKIVVRDNFGTTYKEKYYVADRTSDPAEYFAANFRAMYPDQAKPVDSKDGKPFKKYPFYGRLTERVLYNVAYAQALGDGPFLLDLPLRNGADSLMNWLETKDSFGRKREPVNHPDRCVPVFIQLRDSQNPWFIQPDGSQAIRLPDELADSSKLINLDEILVSKTKEEIISKLQDMYPDLFDKCMEGYPGLLTNAVQPAFVSSRNVQAPVQQAPVQQATLNQPPARSFTPPQDDLNYTRQGHIPTYSQPQQQAPVTAPAVPVNVPGVADISSLPANPMSAGARMSREEALKFINP